HAVGEFRWREYPLSTIYSRLVDHPAAHHGERDPRPAQGRRHVAAEPPIQHREVGGLTDRRATPPTLLEGRVRPRGRKSGDRLVERHALVGQPSPGRLP